ncbi:MAG: hypothetical protein GWP09_01725 [Nitrospiraceae bacterium]|nr:hypothetical protein [Nitrospiraceae bacterium]
MIHYELWAKVVENYLREINKPFKLQSLFNKIDLKEGQIVSGIKYLKKEGKVKKISNRFWQYVGEGQ